jgi:hypothetical protein
MWMVATTLLAFFALLAAAIDLGVRLEPVDTDQITPGSIVLLFRNASVMDNPLPYTMFADATGIREQWAQVDATVRSLRESIDS